VHHLLETWDPKHLKLDAEFDYYLDNDRLEGNLNMND